MKKKGFTLIELLAVIIILGILMLIAIPSVTSYINNSRKETYVTTINELIKGAVTRVNQGDLDMYETDVTYYIPCSCIKTENGTLNSPYGLLNPAYIVVKYDGDNYDYYFTGRDEQGMGVADITKADKITKDSITSNITTINKSIGLVGTTKAKVYSSDCTSVEETNPVSDTVTGEPTSNSGGNNQNTPPPEEHITFPIGRDHTNVETGEEVSIGEETFDVVSNDGETLVLLAKYNLNVGPHSKGTATGRQDPDVLGYCSGTTYGNVAFTASSYWNDGELLGGTPKAAYGGSYSDPNYPNVYDSHADIHTYVDAYKDYVSEQFGRNVEARLLYYSEAVALGCSKDNQTCSGAQSFVTRTSFWLGSAGGGASIWSIYTFGNFKSYMASTYADDYGVRPVIVINYSN